MDLTVREAAPGDARRIRDLHIASIEGLAGQAYSDTQVRVWSHDRDPDDYPISSEETEFLVGTRNGRILGFGWMRLEAEDYFQEAVDGEVTAVYVDPAVARTGIGTRLYRALETRAVHADVVSLGVWSSRNAVPFYEAQGYEHVTTHDIEYRAEVELGVVEMRKSLASGESQSG